jgi:hypothetical protein
VIEVVNMLSDALTGFYIELLYVNSFSLKVVYHRYSVLYC